MKYIVIILILAYSLFPEFLGGWIGLRYAYFEESFKYNYTGGENLYKKYPSMWKLSSAEADK